MPRTHEALIVDSDPKGLEFLAYGFQGAGWRITTCPAAETASLLVKASGADVVIAASRSDHDNVHGLLTQLRSREAFRTVPVLMLGPEELRAPLRQHGQVDLLRLPAFVRDVVTAGRLLAATAATAAPAPGTAPCFEDSFTARDSLSIVRTMNGLARSGSLRLSRKGRHGEILFHEGELTAAQVGQLQGMAAVQHLLVWNGGTMEVRLRPVVRRGQLHYTAQQFLEELDRFQRDYSHAIRDIGPPSTVYLVNHERLQASTGAIPAEVTPVVRLCDGQRTLSDVIDESPFRVLDTARILGRLVELSILNRRDPRPTDVPDDTRPLDAFWATACITAGGATHDAARISKPMPVSAEAEDPSMQKTPPPVDTGARSPRQTQEIAKPAGVASNGQVTSAVVTVIPVANRTAGPEASSTGGNLDWAKPVETAGRGTPALGVSLSGLRPSPARGVPVVQAAAPSPGQTSGTFELKTARPKPHAGRAGDTRRSIVIDTTLVNVVATDPAATDPAATDPAATDPTATNPTATNPTTTNPTTTAPVASIPAEAPEPTEPAALSSPGNSLPVRAATPAPATSDGPSTVAGAGSPPMPDEPQAGLSAPAPSVSPEPPGSPTAGPALALDAVGPAIQALETARALAAPVAEVKKEPSGGRVTGEMHVISSGKPPRGQVKVSATSSFQIDPSLTVDVPVAKPERRREKPSGSQPNQGVHRASGSFSALESDFFEREADLYKDEKTESFADLDDRKSGGKSGPAGRPDKRK